MVRSTRPYQLLIADDDLGFRETLQDVFEPYFVMIVAKSGEEAVEMAESTHVDIALLDMHMRVLTGLDTLRILKSLNVTAPCILITADATDALRKDAEDAEAYSVLAKPITKGELVTTVSTAIEDAYDDPTLFSSAAE